MKSKNQSYIVRNITDLHEREVGERISIGDNGQVGVLKFKSRTTRQRTCSNPVYTRRASFRIEDGTGNNHEYSASPKEIKKVLYIND